MLELHAETTLRGALQEADLPFAAVTPARWRHLAGSCCNSSGVSSRVSVL